jgi:hypothetical protein
VKMNVGSIELKSTSMWQYLFKYNIHYNTSTVYIHLPPTILNVINVGSIPLYHVSKRELEFKLDTQRVGWYICGTRSNHESSSLCYICFSQQYNHVNDIRLQSLIKHGV